MIYVLIIVVTSNMGVTKGTATINQEFNSLDTCKVAATSIVKQLQERRGYVMTTGCYEKGTKK